MTRVEIDLNVRVRGHQTYSGFEHVQGEFPGVGEAVQVFESESSLIGEGRIVDIDYSTSLIYLDVDWSSLRVESSSIPDLWWSVERVDLRGPISDVHGAAYITAVRTAVGVQPTLEPESRLVAHRYWGVTPTSIPVPA